MLRSATPSLFFPCQNIVYAIRPYSNLGKIDLRHCWHRKCLGNVSAGQRNLGLIAAVLTTINYYNLYYSQEARSYILAFLFATLSFLFLIRLLKKMNIKNSILYAVFSLYLLYSHYYSLFVIASQITIIVLLVFFTEKGQRKSYIKHFLLSGIIIAAGYWPWLPYLEAVSRINSFWAPLVPVTFVSDYFFEYFGNMKFLNPILLLLLTVYVFKVFYAEKNLNSN